VRVGFFSFTEVTDPAAHRAYNAWHQLDHLPEQYSIPGIVLGQRWVATPACRGARAVDGPMFTDVHYLTQYLMVPPVAETLAAFGALAVRLREEGRFFAHRRSHLSGPFALGASAAAGRALVSPEVVPWRPNRGVYAVVEKGASALAPVAPARLLAVPGVAGAWTFTAGPDLQAVGWRPGDRRVTVCYLDEDPLSVSPALDALVVGAESPFSDAVVFAGPFETIVPWAWDWFD